MFMNNTGILLWNAGESFRCMDLGCRVGKIVEVCYDVTEYDIGL